MSWKVIRSRSDENSDAAPPFRISGTVGRVESPPPQAFLKRYVTRNRPVVVVGGMERWKALNQWSPDYLRKVAGDHAGEVIISSNGLFPDYVTKPEPMAKRDMRFDEFLDRATGNGEPKPPILSPTETYYIYGKPYLFKAFPKLAEDVPQPSCLRDVKIASLNLWMSTTGCTTPLHYDLTNGLLAQVWGSKQVYLFDPSQQEALYQRGSRFPGMDNYERQSRVDIHHPDYRTYPNFKQANALACTLRPGDMLFLPSNWFHEVETLEFSLSVSFTFAGGTATSEFATIAERFKEQCGSGTPDLAALQQQLMQNPQLMMELMQSPMMQEMMRDPKVLKDLQKMMLSRG